jgi:uncharacterized protein (TIGR00304 family)
MPEYFSVKALDAPSVTGIGFLLIVFGFILAVVAMIIMIARSSRGTTQGRSAGLLLIGPIPIIFGSDKQSTKAVIILAIVLMLIVLAIMLLPSLIGH